MVCMICTPDARGQQAKGLRVCISDKSWVHMLHVTSDMPWPLLLLSSKYLIQNWLTQSKLTRVKMSYLNTSFLLHKFGHFKFDFVAFLLMVLGNTWIIISFDIQVLFTWCWYISILILTTDWYHSHWNSYKMLQIHWLIRILSYLWTTLEHVIVLSMILLLLAKLVRLGDISKKKYR